MKKMTLACCFITIFSTSVAQIALNEESFNHLINQQFARVIGSNSNSSIGSFAEYDLIEGKLKYNSNIQFKSGTIIGLNANGGLTDGILPIFSDNKFNTNIGFGASINFLKPDKALRFNDDDSRKLNSEIRKVNNKFLVDSLYILSGSINRANTLKLEKLKLDSIKLDEELALALDAQTKSFHSLEIANKKVKLEAQTKDLEEKLRKAKSKKVPDSNQIKRLEHQIAKSESSIRLLELDIDESQNVIDSLRKAKDTLRYQLATFREQIKSNGSTNQQLVKLRAMKNKSLKRLRTVVTDSLLQIKGFRIAWFSIGYDFTHNGFRHIDTKMAFDEQVTYIKFSTNELFVQYSLYDYKPYRNSSYFFNGGFKVGQTRSYLKTA